VGPYIIHLEVRADASLHGGGAAKLSWALVGGSGLRRQYRGPFLVYCRQSRHAWVSSYATIYFAVLVLPVDVLGLVRGAGAIL
jgi:hypothetical protein